MTAVHDYAGLVRLLFQLRVFPDDLGWTNLSEKEAAEIRSFGFEAAPGRSKVPTPLPPELVAGTPLENLSIGWEKFQADFLRASQVQKPAGQPSARDREVVDPPAPPRQREIAVQVLRKREANGNASHVNRQNPHARCGKRVPRSPWELIERRRPRKAAGEDPFEDMPEPARSEAPRIFARLCEKWDSKDPNWRREKRWRKPLLVGRARWLATHPPDSSWGRSMASRQKARGRKRKITNPGGAHRRRVRRQLGLKPASAKPIGLFCTQFPGGKARFMEYAWLAARLEPRLAYVVETYESLKPWRRAAVSIDELCVKYGIDPARYLSVVGEAAVGGAADRYGNSLASSLAAELRDIASRFRSNQPESPMASSVLRGVRSRA